MTTDMETTVSHTTAAARRSDPTETIETVLDYVLLIAVATMAAVFSWHNVLQLATDNGQDGWLAWVVAGCIETGAIKGGLEFRRRRRLGQDVWFPVVLVVVAAGLQLAAQLAEVDPTHGKWGYVLAAVPAATFLTLIKLTISRSSTPGGPLAEALAQASAADARARAEADRAAAADAGLAQALAQVQAAEQTAHAEAGRAEAALAQVQALQGQVGQLARDLEQEVAQGQRRQRTGPPAGTTTDADRLRVIRAELRKNIGAGKNPIKAAIIAADHSPGGTEHLQELINQVRAELTQGQVVPLHAAEA